MSDSINVEELEVVPGFEHQNLQGRVWEPSNEEELREGLEKAFDYRGDVTIVRKDNGTTTVEGYIFDRRAQSAALLDSVIRLFPKGDPTKASRSRIPTSPACSSPVATRQPERVGKRGSESTGKRKPPARRILS